MSELGVEDGHTMTALLAASVPAKAPEYVDDLHLNPTNPGALIATTEGYFEVLFRLMQSDGDPEISSHVWNLLMAVPTNQKILDPIAQMGQNTDAGFEPLDWVTQLQASAYYSSIYVLQIADAQLMPADDQNLPHAAKWRREFIQSGGFAHALQFFMDGDFVNKPGQSVALRIIRCCLFGANQESSATADIETIPDSPVRSSLLTNFDYPGLLNKLVFVVIQEQENDTEQSEEVLMDALYNIECILMDKDLSDVMLQIQQIECLLVNLLLQNPHEVVRKQIGSSLYPALVNGLTDDGFCQVLGMLTKSLESLDPTSMTTQQYFDLLITLIPSAAARRMNMQHLLHTLIQKLHTLPNGTADVLVGCLQVLSELVQSQQELIASMGATGAFSKEVFDHFLFSMPASHDKENWPLCRTADTRQAAFSLLGAMVQCSVVDRRIVVELVRSLCSGVPEVVRSDWSCEPNFAKKAECGFVGLKNQGCTCYMNALLQQLYMVPLIREGLLGCDIQMPVFEEDHLAGADLVGRRIRVVYSNCKEYESEVVEYNPDTDEHTIRYDDGHKVCYRLSEGQEGKEKPGFQVVRGPPTEREETMKVLYESKRCFRYLADSQMRYYDPRLLVDACKVLNLQFNVYQQNDSAEFCDKLLDRWEKGMKGTEQATLLAETCYGEQVKQKIPKEPLQGEETCRKKNSSPQQFMLLALTIRGKESVYEMLAAHTANEVMDGDNKIKWEETDEYRDTIIRDVFAKLPNLLMLHLKRFDLDYNTFETVKFNNRVSFPTTLYMKPFTKEGVEEREAAAEAEAMQAAEAQADIGGKDGDVDDPAPGQSHQPTYAEIAAEVAAMPEEEMDPNYVYKLGGVVIHSGYAQGGHYYSFIKDRGTDKWYKFDDETVTDFDISNLEQECFGGVQSRPQSTLEYGKWVTQDVEMESMMNALVLVYEKVVPTGVTSDTVESDVSPEEEQAADADAPPTWAVEEDVDVSDHTGPSCGKNEESSLENQVWEANSSFVRNSYLFDTDFHNFQLKLLNCMPSHDDAAEVLVVIQMGTEFLFNVLLHARDKSAVKAWVSALQNLYDQNQVACQWLLTQLTGEMRTRWLSDVLFECFVPQARNALVDLAAHAVRCLSPSERELLQEATSKDALTENRRDHPSVHHPSVIITLLNTMVSLLGDAAKHWKSFDQYFLLWLRLAETDEVVRAYMCSRDYIALLANFFLGPKSPIRHRFPLVTTTYTQVLGPNYGPLVQAILALVGVPMIRRVSLLEDDCVVYSQDAKLSEAAVRALTKIFSDFASEQNGIVGMSSSDINKYFNACDVYDNLTYFSDRIAGILKEHQTTADGRLSLQGFLSFYKDVACKDENLVWKDLRKLGWREDLCHESQIPQGTEAQNVQIPSLSQEILLSEEFYEAATNEKATADAVQCYTYICRSNPDASAAIVEALLHRIQSAQVGWKGERFVEGCVAGLGSLLDLEDSLQEERLRLAIDGPQGILATAAKLSQSDTEVVNLSKSDSEAQIRNVYRLIKILLALMKKSTAVTEWLTTNKAEWAWTVQWLHAKSLHPALSFTPNFGRHFSKMETLRTLTEIHGEETYKNDISQSEDDVYTVAGAGSNMVNGLYKYAGTHDGVPMYTKQPGTSAETQNFQLYRCTLTSGAQRWYISDVVKTKPPGTSADQDYYWAPQDLNQSLPPSHGWTTCRTSVQTDMFSGGIDPPPLVSVCSVESPPIDTVASEMEI